MLTLEEKIKQMLAKKIEESSQETNEEIVSEEQVDEAKCSSEMKKEEDATLDAEEVKISPKKKEAAEMKEESDVKAELPVTEEQKVSVSEQVSQLLSVEGLSEDFRVQAVAIFEAAVADRTMQIEEELKQKFDEQYEQAKTDLVENIDGYLSEAVVKWLEDNQVALVHSFKADLAESFIDGLRQLFVEHSVNIPEESENALDVAISEIETLEAKLEEQKQAEQTLVQELNEIKRERILESFKTKMTNTEADRFVKLVEGIKFESAEQYSKQLEIVSENFSVSKTVATQEQLDESKTTPVVTENTAVTAYAEFFKRLNG